MVYSLDITALDCNMDKDEKKVMEKFLSEKEVSLFYSPHLCKHSYMYYSKLRKQVKKVQMHYLFIYIYCLYINLLVNPMT